MQISPPSDRYKYTASTQQSLCLVEYSRGIMSWPLLLLISFVLYVHGISLTSSPAEVKPPGASVKLSCQISGYALTSYGTSWIRQSPGKGLEWIGITWGGGGIASGASFKTRFSISRDTSNNRVLISPPSTQTFASAPLLLLALAPYVFCATELTQPDSVVIKPGETLTITCRVSGASITESSSHYGTAWIRKPAGKSLEWINIIDNDGDIYKEDSLKDKSVISRDTSSNNVTLQGQNMQTEDTAVYYCMTQQAAVLHKNIFITTL
ncbi:uncharacterized protein LOC128616901 [Ictalurus furcatus]|uniref:uncharacterized protein LOC128616901 n=1 Tax=Ictalurus furcatus TaxID=66913 RepID=UPI0023505D26|nr:uncharacterized protein LOC128616901 [Ictalurus furcatus]